MSHLAVVGAGFGGLAAALRARHKGWRVTVYEALPDPGGRARVFEQDGFSFDAGPTVITAPYLLDELFELFGRDSRDAYTLVEVDPFYRIAFHDGSTFDYVGDEERLLAQIAAFNPRDVDGYRALADHARRIFDIGYTELADQPFDDVRAMLRAVPKMLRLGNYRSVYAQVAHYIKDERLRQAFTFQPLLIGGNPFDATSIYLLIHWLERKWGVHYALGGTASIVRALVDLATDVGVEFEFGTPVEQIEVQGDDVSAVILQGGRRVACDHVVCNADPTTVYRDLVAPSARHRHGDRAVARVKNSMSLLVGYFGTDKLFDQQAHHTIVLGPRYEGLLDDIFRRRRLADDLSLYLHAPTRTDPSVAPPGHESMYVLAPVPNLRADIDWDHLAEATFEKILATLEARILPSLRDHIVTSKLITPTYFRDTLRSADGAAFGPEPLLTQSAWFRYHNRSPDVGGLWFVGAGTHPGAGVPGVLCSAKVLDRILPDAPARSVREGASAKFTRRA